MWASYFFGAGYAQDLAGFVAEYRLLDVQAGRSGSFSMDHGRSLAGAVPAPAGTIVIETVTFPVDTHGAQEAFRTGNGPTDRRGIFQDSYRFGFRGSLPADFRLVMEQTYRVSTDPVYDAVGLAAGGAPPSVTKNQVAYEADYPNFKIILRTSDGRGGWRLLWSDRSDRVRIAAP